MSLCRLEFAWDRISGAGLMGSYVYSSDFAHRGPSTVEKPVSLEVLNLKNPANSNCVMSYPFVVVICGGFFGLL